MFELSNNDRPDQVEATSQNRVSKSRRRFAWALVAVWSLVVTAGMGLLVAYANTAGKQATGPASIDPISDTTSRPYRLFMFLHPQCPCSVASVNELARLMTRCGQQLDATVYFERPESEPAGWEHGSLWDSASAIPGVHVETDVGSQIADRFQANTSGEVLLYDRAGKLRFHGGITSARGHAGDNLGESAVVSIALGGTSSVESSPIFGCPFRAEVADRSN